MKHWTDIELLDYIDNKIEGSLAKQIASQIKSNPVLLQRIENLKSINQSIKNISQQIPSPKLSENFYTFLEEEKIKQISEPKFRTKRIHLKWIVGIAAGLLILLTGYFIYETTQTKGMLIQLNQELALTKSKMLNQLKTGTTSARVEAVNQTYDILKFDPEVLETLVHTFETDKSPIVRLTALEALTNYADEQTLKQLLIENLQNEKDASIQITMIHLLTNIKASNAVQPLEELIKDDGVLDEVKGEAQMSIYKIDSYQKM